MLLICLLGIEYWMIKEIFGLEMLEKIVNIFHHQKDNK